MIPSQNIVAWATVVPWVEPRQVEQDLIISRSLVEIFSDRRLRDALRFRGGTALNKLHLPSPLRERTRSPLGGFSRTWSTRSPVTLGRTRKR